MLDGGYPRLMASPPAKPQKKVAQQVDYGYSWWPGVESTRAKDAPKSITYKKGWQTRQ